AHGNARRMRTMDELLEQADVVSLHVDGRPGNAGLFGEEQFRRMKPRSLFINASRGMVVDDQALAEHIRSGHIAGAAIDVFPIEPKAQGDPFDSALRGLDNVILTPHVGGSTQEAQEEIGYFVSNKLANFIDAGSTELSVNLPVVAAPRLTSGSRVAILHQNVPGVLASVNQLLFEHHDNVLAQYLATRGELGYVIADVEGPSTDECISAIEAADWNHWVRTYNA
ncbi:MAG TPA: NAD(P)-dependent oxidoreductase, partial [Marmoricola sp.]|nr:NAD(P)-dependent oxidoreductase [Marmoricola sp.]